MKKILTFLILIVPVICFTQTTFCNEKQCINLDKSYTPVVLERQGLFWFIASRNIPEHSLIFPVQETCNYVGEKFKIIYISISYKGNVREFELDRIKLDDPPIEKHEVCYSNNYI